MLSHCSSDGFITIAPDALSPLGGYPGNDDDGAALQEDQRNKMKCRKILLQHSIT